MKPLNNYILIIINYRSASDDHQLLQWNLAKNETTKVTDVSSELFPTGMQWPPKNGLVGGVGGNVRKGTELLLVTAADGHFHLLGRGGRAEKSVQAHKGYTATYNQGHP